jgi:hypothetical protein
MRKILVVVVIASAACVEPLEPAPPTPVVGAQGTDPLPDLEQTFGPVIASGTEAGRSWSLRGMIDARGAAVWLETSTAGGGCGGGGLGALPFQDLGWKKLGHFGSVGSGECHGTGVPLTLTLNGVVSKQTATIEARLADGTSLPVQIIDTGDPRASFFVAVWSTPSWEVLIARDAAGAELESYRQPPDPS